MISISACGRKAGLGGDLIVVPDPQITPAHPLGIVVVSEGKMVFGVEPPVVGPTQSGKRPAFDHVIDSLEGVRSHPLC
jgi:hypothetical protein